MTSLIAALALQTPISVKQEWRRSPTPGIEYQRIQENDPPRSIYVLRFAKGAEYRPVATLARDFVYDLTPSNGRATLTEMIETSGAIGGINADFFQWGADPGGDPIDLMVRNGELISHPEGNGGDWQYAYGWNYRGDFMLARPTWDCSIQWSGKKRPIVSLNSYTTARDLTLSTSTAGYAISKKPATFLVVRTGRAVVSPEGTFDGVVEGRTENVEKLRVNPGTMVISSQSEREALRAIPIGTKVKIKTKVSGFDWKRIDNVVGGGPVLISKGKVVPSSDRTRNPRSAVGRDAQGRLVFVVIDGRQSMSVGSTLPETAEIMKGLGCIDALNLDGGGSSSIDLFGMILNRPSGGIERMVANSILWYGPKPQTMSIPLRLAIDHDLTAGTSSKITLIDEAGRPVGGNSIIWSAQGDAWIDGDGTLRGLKEGTATVSALIDGRLYVAKFPVAKG